MGVLPPRRREGGIAATPPRRCEGGRVLRLWRSWEVGMEAVGQREGLDCSEVEERGW
jgi:hypothetical protein